MVNVKCGEVFMKGSPGTNMGICVCLLGVIAVNGGVCRGQVSGGPGRDRVSPQRSEPNLAEIPFKIVYETFRTTKGRENWELYQINADGSEPINLTNTPGIDEMYPHVSGDGTKICFVVDRGTGRRKVRSVWYMNADGTERARVASNARQPCWSPDGKSIAYLKGEFDRYTTREYATSDLVIFDLQNRKYRRHPNRKLHHMYAICWSADSNWFVGVVHGGMGYSDTILAFEADATRVFDLERWGVKGCRPDLGADGVTMVWGETDWNLSVGRIDLTSDVPRVGNIRDIIKCPREYKIYHVDLSPDGRYIAFSYGPSEGGQQVGGKAKGWNICVGDLAGRWVKITTDGNHNKEPDWVPARPGKPAYAPRSVEDL